MEDFWNAPSHPVPSLPHLPGTEPCLQWPLPWCSRYTSVYLIPTGHTEGCPPHLGRTGSPGALGVSCVRAGKQTPESRRHLGHHATPAPLPSTGPGPAVRGRRTRVVKLFLHVAARRPSWAQRLAGRVSVTGTGSTEGSTPAPGCWGRDSRGCRDTAWEQGQLRILLVARQVLDQKLSLKPRGRKGVSPGW